MKSQMKNVIIPMPESLYYDLKKSAESINKPATEIARFAIESWLVEHKDDESCSDITEEGSPYEQERPV